MSVSRGIPKLSIRRRVSALVVVASLAGSSSAAAEDALAEARYREGRRAALAQDWEEACRLFRESLDLEGAPGTLLNLADCEEHIGSLLAARAHFDAAAKGFRAGKRADYAKERLAAVTGRIPKLTVRLAPGMPSDAVVERDGMVLDPASLGVATAVDPGEHTLVVRHRGRVEAPTRVLLVAGQSREVELTTDPTIARAPSGEVPHARPRQWVEDDVASRRTGLRVGSFIALGLGAAGLVAGTIGGIVTLGAKRGADENCAATCNPDGMNAQDRGKTWSTVSTVGFVAGGVGLASGIGLLLLSSKGSAVSAQPVAGGGALRWTGHF